jgi:tetraacyldisaccharide 4'-kinase
MSPSSQRAWFEIVSGRRTGPGAAFARAGLSALAALYGGALTLRSAAFALGLRRRHRLPGPVIGVGNITLGGTGKTPMVEMITRRLEARGLKVAVLSRGYGKEVGGVDDEGFAAGKRYTGPDRLALARKAFADGNDAVVLDDGFHDLRLQRDFNIAMVDASTPFGNGRLFPRGVLRESPHGLKRADVIVVSRADMLDAGELALLRAHLTQLSGGRPTAAAIHRPRAPRALSGAPAADSLAGKRVLGFCGLGNPLGFEATLKGQRARVLAYRPFPDHHAYSPTELDGLEAEARELEVDALVTTEKDAARLADREWTVPVWVVGVDLEIVNGAEELEAGLARIEDRFRQRASTRGAVAEDR